MSAESLTAIPDAQTLAMVALALLTGAMSPTYYAAERLRGLGRSLVGRLPYEPPPGMEREQALVEATDDVDASDTETSPNQDGGAA